MSEISKQPSNQTQQETSKMLYLYVETPLHVGSGRALGTIDLPIQRERLTEYPMVQSSSLKGKLRAVTKDMLTDVVLWEAIFGPESITSPGDAYAGALAPGDAKLLLFPLRSLAGVFVWATSVEILQRFARDCSQHPSMAKPNWPVPTSGNVPKGTAWVKDDQLVIGKHIVLEDFTFTADKSQATLVAIIATWLQQYAMPQSPEYAYWRNALSSRLVILDNDAFRDFTLFATEVQTHIRIDQTTKTVQEGALWTTESLPTDTLLYAPLSATATRTSKKSLTAAAVLKQMRDLNLLRIQLGGNESTGRGIVRLQL